MGVPIKQTEGEAKYFWNSSQTTIIKQLFDAMDSYFLYLRCRESGEYCYNFMTPNPVSPLTQVTH